MTRRIVNIGDQGNDGTGDSIREAFRKVNENFQDLYSVFGSDETIRFTDLSDTPSLYEEGQVFIAESTEQITGKKLVAGNGITITIDNDILIESNVGVKDSPAELSKPLNAKKFVIGNLVSPDDAEASTAVDAWNVANSSAGVSLTTSDLPITKRYADAHYQASSGTGPFTVRSMPATTAESVKIIASYPNGNVRFTTAHQFSPTGADNGKSFVFTTDGTPAIPLVNNTVYYIRYVDATTVSLFSTSAGAKNNTLSTRVSITAPGSGNARLTYTEFDPTLSGNWLKNEALPRSEITRRQGDTMTGFLTLHSDPTSEFHAATKRYVDNATRSTTAIPEGTNLYYTSARATADARSAIRVTKISGLGSIAYSDGEIRYTGPSSDEVRGTFTAGNGISIVDGVISNTVSQYGNEQTRSAVSATTTGLGSLTYNTTTGVFAYSGPTAADVRNLLSVVDNGGLGSLTYANGVFTYRGATDSEIRSRFTPGIGVSLSAVGDISIGQDVGTTASPTFANVTVTGNLNGDLLGNILTASQPNITSLGTLSAVSVAGLASLSNVSISGSLLVTGSQVAFDDPILTINGTTAPAADSGKDSGLEFRWHNGTSSKVGFLGFDRSESALTFIPDATITNSVVSGPVGKIKANLEGTVTGTVSSISNFTTSDLIEGTNKYYTDERVDDRVASILQAAGNITITYDDAAGTITIGTIASGGALDLSSNNTDHLKEGTTNKYYNTAIARQEVLQVIAIEDAGAGLCVSDVTFDGVNKFILDRVPNSSIQSLFEPDTATGVVFNSVNGKVKIGIDPEMYPTIAGLETAWSTLVQGGTGITTTFENITRPVITVSLTSDKVTINSKQVALGGSLSLTADDIPNGLTNKWYTDDDARAAVGPMYTDADARAAVGPIDTAPTANTIVKRTAAGGMHGTHVSNSAFTLDLTNNKTLLATDLTSNIGVITTSGTGKVLVMPVSTNCSGMWVVLRNKGANSVIIRDSFGDPITTLNSSSIVSLICDGEDWLSF